MLVNYLHVQSLHVTEKQNEKNKRTSSEWSKNSEAPTSTLSNTFKKKLETDDLFSQKKMKLLAFFPVMPRSAQQKKNGTLKTNQTTLCRRFVFHVLLHNISSTCTVHFFFGFALMIIVICVFRFIFPTSLFFTQKFFEIFVLGFVIAAICVFRLYWSTSLFFTENVLVIFVVFSSVFLQ